MILECMFCEAIVNAVELKNYEIHSWEDPPCKYTLLKCPRCERPFLVVQEDYGAGWDDPGQLYPPIEKRINPSIPESIRNAFQEALTCFKSKTYTAAAIMCRKTLEGICDDHEIKRGNLASRLKEMKDKELIESHLFEWAELLRVFGNEAAHDVSVTISRTDSKDAIEFTEALLEYVYTYRDKFERFMLRRGHKTDDIITSLE